MKPETRDTKTKFLIDQVLSKSLMVLMSLMVLNVTWQVLSRYVAKNPASFTDELSRYMLIWLGMLGAAYVAGKDQHLAIDILPQKLSGKPKARLLTLIYTLVLVFALISMVFGGANLVYITFILEQKSATLQIPLAYIYAIIPISGLFVIYYQTVAILEQVKILKS